MKKPVTTEGTFCDLCGEEKEEPAESECIICGKDICPRHRISVTVDMIPPQFPGARVFLCIPDAKPLLPFLERMVGKSNKRNAGPPAEYNEMRIEDLIAFIGGRLIRSRAPNN